MIAEVFGKASPTQCNLKTLKNAGRIVIRFTYPLVVTCGLPQEDTGTVCHNEQRNYVKIIVYGLVRMETALQD